MLWRVGGFNIGGGDYDSCRALVGGLGCHTALIVEKASHFQQGTDASLGLSSKEELLQV